LDAVHNMQKIYNINKDRIYIAGFSGGGRASSFLIHGYSDVFSGGYFMMGSNFYGVRKNESGIWEAGIDGLKWHGQIDQIKKNTKLVLMCGEGDTICLPEADRAVYETLLLDGFVRVSLIKVPRLGHRQPDASWFEKGIAALESEPKKPPTVSPTKEPNPLPGQMAQAKRILISAQIFLDMRGKSTEHVEKINRKYLQRVLDEYPTTPAASTVRDLLDQIDKKTSP
jgi:hypothetical protein